MTGFNFMEENTNRIPWSEWRIKAQNSYVKGKYTAQDMIKDWGYPSDWDVDKNKIIFRKGIPGAYSRKARKTNRKIFNSKRKLKSNISTYNAEKANQQLDALHKAIKDEASLFQLTDSDIDELFTEHGISLNSFDNFDFQGASNDPDNKYINGKRNSLPKNEAEELLKNRGLASDFVIFNDVEGGNRIELASKFDRAVDNFEQGKVFTSIDEVNSFINSNLPKTDYLQPSPALQNVLDDTFKPKLSLRTKAKLAAAASLVPGMLGTAADAAETAIRFDIARQSNNPVDYLQAGISAATTALGATNVGDVAGVPLELLNGSISQHREGLPQIRGRSGAKRASK